MEGVIAYTDRSYTWYNYSEWWPTFESTLTPVLQISSFPRHIHPHALSCFVLSSRYGMMPSFLVLLFVCSCSPLLRHDGLAGSRDGAVSSLHPTYLLHLQELHGAYGAVQPYAGFEPQKDAQGATKYPCIDMSTCWNVETSICRYVEMLTCWGVEVLKFSDVEMVKY